MSKESLHMHPIEDATEQTTPPIAQKEQKPAPVEKKNRWNDTWKRLVSLLGVSASALTPNIGIPGGSRGEDQDPFDARSFQYQMNRAPSEDAYLDLVGTPTVEQQADNETDQCVIPEYSSNARVRVVNQGVNLRAEPNTSSAVYEFLEAGTRIIAEPENELWSRVTYIINADGTCVEARGGYVANAQYTTELGFPGDFIASTDNANPTPTSEAPGQNPPPAEDGEHLTETSPVILPTSVTIFNEQINEYIAAHPELSQMFTPMLLSEQENFVVNGVPRRHGYIPELVRSIGEVESLPISGTFRGYFRIALEISGVTINSMVLVQEVVLYSQATNSTRSQFMLYDIATGDSDAYSPVFRVPGNELTNIDLANPIPNLITHDEVNNYITSLEPGTQIVVELVPAVGEPLDRYNILREHLLQGITTSAAEIASDSWVFNPFTYYVGDGQQVAEAG